MESQITYGSVYQTIGDVPEEGVAYILPLEDVKDETYVWITPECEVEVPGMPLYRLACDKAQLAGDFGFKASSSFSASGVIAISACSDWEAYAERREEGQWEQEKAAIMAGASASATNGNQTTASSPSTSASTGTTPDTPATASHTPDTAAPSPLSASNYVSSFPQPVTCYLAFTPAGSWSTVTTGGDPAYIVTGFSGGKMTLTEIESAGDDFPASAFPFRVSSNPPTLTDASATFAIQNAETGEYLSWTSADGFGWEATQGASTQFSTPNAYSGNGFEMNISYDTSALTATGQANGDYASQGWTFWIAKA